MLALTLAVMLQFKMTIPADEVPANGVLRLKPAAVQQHQYDDGAGPRYYVCPKDETLLRVKSADPHAEYKCPVDGTVMRAGAGPQTKFFLLEEKR